MLLADIYRIDIYRIYVYTVYTHYLTTIQLYLVVTQQSLNISLLYCQSMEVKLKGLKIKKWGGSHVIVIPAGIISHTPISCDRPIDVNILQE